MTSATRVVPAIVTILVFIVLSICMCSSRVRAWRKLQQFRFRHRRRLAENRRDRERRRARSFHNRPHSQDRRSNSIPYSDAGAMAAERNEIQRHDSFSNSFLPLYEPPPPALEKARAIAHKDPAIAATVLWNIARDIAQHDLSAVEPVLRDLLACLQRMEEDPALCGSKGSPAAWSTRKILKTMLECRLALARALYAKDYSRVESTEQYTLAVCQYLGISESCVEYSNTERNPSAMSKEAFADVSAIPRKFGKQEDVVQAIDAMDEAASALLVFSMEKKAGEDDALAWRGIGFYFIMHAFALDKSDTGAAYKAVEQLSLVFELLGMSHFGNECAMLIIEHHMGRPGAQADVASAVMGSLMDNDLVRARRLLDALNNTAFKQPWSQYMAEFVARRAVLDNLWIYQDAWNSWTNVSLALQKSDINVFMILNDGLDCILSPYKWCYSPTCLDVPDQPEL
ncbi:hypothetical protein IWW48_003835 [Coemansia sp. RSA 1200]|nr:hypothetical protein IWW48_003835 [Coemansia sp. RSA 1200]